MSIRHQSASITPDFPVKLDTENSPRQRLYVPTQPYPWRTVVVAAMLGPALAGAPYIWAAPAMIIVFVVGFLPALTGGALFACWLQFARFPGTWKGAGVGSMYGAITSAIFVIGFFMIEVPSGAGSRYWQTIFEGAPFIAFFSLHGALAGAIVGAIESRSANKRNEQEWENLQPLAQRSVGETS